VINLVALKLVEISKDDAAGLVFIGFIVFIGVVVVGNALLSWLFPDMED
jgi:hypothetical protein